MTSSYTLTKRRTVPVNDLSLSKRCKTGPETSTRCTNSRVKGPSAALAFHFPTYSHYAKINSPFIAILACMVKTGVLSVKNIFNVPRKSRSGQEKYANKQ